MAQKVQVTVGPLATADPNGIAESQTPGAAGDLTLDGVLVVDDVAVLDTPRRILITTSADETSKTFTLYGTDWNGNDVSETIAGVNNTTVQSVYDYSTITRIAVSAALAGAVIVGTNGVASSRPIFLDEWMPAPVSLQAVVSGTVNFTVQQTLDDPTIIGATMGYTGVTWVNHPDTALAAATATAQGNYAYAPRMVRVLLNSGTGSVTLTTLQSGSMM